MALLRALAGFVFGGALLGMVAVTLVYPKYKAWDNTSAAGKSLCDCAEVTRQTADGLISAQLTGCASGGSAGLVLGAVVMVARRRKAAAKAHAEAVK